MKHNMTVVLATVFVLVAVLFIGVLGAPNGSVAQDGEQPCPDAEIIPERSTVPQDESTSLAVQVHNQVNRDCFVLVRVFEPAGVSGMRVDGEPPVIPHNNTDMWQSSETLGPRQRLAIPITIEPGSNPGEHPVYVQVKYFHPNSSYTGQWEKGTLAVERCSATCVARGTVKAVMEFIVAYRNSVIALLSLVVAIVSLSFATVRTD